MSRLRALRPTWLGNEWALLVGLLVASALAVGTVHFEAVLAFGVGVILIGASNYNSLPSSWSAPATGLLALAIWSIAGAVPLPLGVVRVLSPETYDWSQNTARLIGDLRPRFQTLSLAPVASLVEGIKWSAYAVIFTLSSDVAKRNGHDRVFLAVWIAAVVVAVVTLGHRLLGLPSLFGIYHPATPHSETNVSVFLNPNNLSGYLNLGFFCGMGLLASRRTLVTRGAVIGGSGACFLVSLLSESRGGILTLLAGCLGVATVLYVGKRSGAGGRSIVRAVLASSLGVGIVACALAAASGAWGDAFELDLSKLEELDQLLPVLKDYFWVGVGRGAFETISSVYHQRPGAVVFNGIECFPVGWLAEWGVPMGGLALLGLAWSLSPSRLCLVSRGSKSRAIAWMGIVVLLVHNLVDLGLEVFSLCAALFAILGSLDASARETRSPSGNQLAHVFLPLALLTLATSTVGAAMIGADVQSTRDSLGKAFVEGDASPKQDGELSQRISRAMHSYPSESYFPLLGALKAGRDGEDAFPWAAAALKRAPTSARIHYVLAQSFAQRGARTQALLHIRHALKADIGMQWTFITFAAEHARTLDELLAVAEPSRDRAGVLIALAYARNDVHSPQLLEAAFAYAPLDRRVLTALGTQLLSVVTAHTRGCDESTRATPCDANASKAAEERLHNLIARLGENAATQCDADQLKAQLLALQNHQERAEALLAKACNLCAAPEPCQRMRVSLAQALDDPTRRKAAANAYHSFACQSPASCSKADRWLGSLAEARGAWLEAYKHYRRAGDESGSGEAWLAAARVAVRAQNQSLARNAYTQAARLGISDPSIEAAVNKLDPTVPQLLPPPPSP